MLYTSTQRLTGTLPLTGMAMIAFAANSLLCRMALSRTGIDPLGFTLLRLFSGASALLLIVALRDRRLPREGSWSAATALFVYAAGFSLAYLRLSAATGALLLFFSVQATMIGASWWRGERLSARQGCGLLLAILGLILLLAPGLTAPPVAGALLMSGAGIAWGIFTLLGRDRSDPLATSAGNFLRTLPFVLLLLAVPQGVTFDPLGSGYAVVSGALTSAGGYVIWYAALRRLRVTSAAVVQLSVPLLTALLAVPLLGESLDLRLVLSGMTILGGIALTLTSPGVASGAQGR